MLLSARL